MDRSCPGWPNDADGDVLRRLEAGGFDFSRNYPVDFFVDFPSWPPPADALSALKAAFPDLKVVEPDGATAGYVAFDVLAPVTYDLVTRVQAQASALVAAHGGSCESWGVLHD
jgi:hypothetical protein